MTRRPRIRNRDLRGTPEQQQTGLDYMAKLIDQMEVLNCPSLIGPVYSAVGRADAVPSDEYKQQWQTVVGHLKTLCKYAQKKGKQVCLEPLNRFETDFINTCAQGLDLINDVDSPALKLHLDTFHMNIEEKGVANGIIRAREHLKYIHLSESDRGVPGTGTVAWDEVFGALAAIGFKGGMAMESFIELPPQIASALSVWRSVARDRQEVLDDGLPFLRNKARQYGLI